MFTLSSHELVKITDSWARIAKTIAHDLRVIGDSDLQPAVREAIAALPPEMRHAWVEGNAKQRQAIAEMLPRGSVDKLRKPRNGLPQRGSHGPGLQGRGGPATIVWRLISRWNQRIDRPRSM